MRRPDSIQMDKPLNPNYTFGLTDVKKESSNKKAIMKIKSEELTKMFEKSKKGDFKQGSGIQYLSDKI